MTATAMPPPDMPPELDEVEPDSADEPKLGVGTGAAGTELGAEVGAAVVGGSDEDDVDG